MAGKRERAQLETFTFADDGATPNNPSLEVLLYRGAFAHAAPAAIKAQLAANGWGGVWQGGVYDRHHYHPNAHEVLAVASGEARLMLGGASGREVEVKAGDVAILPAGTGHRRLAASEDFAVIGAYPRGQEDYDIIWSEPARIDEGRARIAKVALPGKDPVYGAEGDLTRRWQGPKGTGSSADTPH